MGRAAEGMRICGTQVYLLPVRARTPLKFGAETLTEVTCARVRVEAQDSTGRRVAGWGETPLSVQWVWPGALPYSHRLDRLIELVMAVAKAFAHYRVDGHPMEIGSNFQRDVLTGLLDESNRRYSDHEPMPWLAALLCFSAFDLAAHDAFGWLAQRPTFETLGPEHLTRDLSAFMDGESVFAGKYPADYLLHPRRDRLVAWHLVGGLDLLEPSDLSGPPPDDGYPVLLGDWIRHDRLRCLKVKLRGTDATWDFQRLVRVGKIAESNAVEWLSADFNCTVQTPDYVNEILDRLKADHPRIHQMILYVEQPFAYDLSANAIDVRSVAARKPLFLDESAHDWRHVRLGRELGWTGVALKTCKTLSGALLSACWARQHGMELMVQDLTNPMLAQVSHVLLAAHVPTIMGVETNSMQFYPDASQPEAAVHPNLYRRRDGTVDLSTVTGYGLGYRLAEMRRELPAPIAAFEA